MVRTSSPLIPLTPCQLSDASHAVELVEDQEIVTCSSTNKLIGLAEIDTVGAGDTFNAACLATLRAEDALAPSVLETLSYEKLTKMLTTANRTAAVTVSRTGANPPWANEL